ATEERVRDRSRLLEDLLQHEVLVARLRGGDRVERDRPGWAFDLRAVGDAPEPHARRGHDREVTGLKEAQLAGVLEERGHVRGDEDLALPVADAHATGGADARC